MITMPSDFFLTDSSEFFTLASLDWERLLKRAFHRIGTTTHQDIKYLMSLCIISDSILTLHRGLEMGQKRHRKAIHFLPTSDSSLLPSLSLLTHSPLGIIALEVYDAL